MDNNLTEKWKVKKRGAELPGDVRSYITLCPSSKWDYRAHAGQSGV